MSKIMRVFYDNAGLPYKDSALSIHYPILEGGEFVGANNTTDIYFYTENLGDFYFVANCKLPNGALVDKLLIAGSDDFGTYYALSLDSELTENKGHLKVALKGYGGNVSIEEESDGETTIVVINGTPTIVATGIVDIAINYAPLIHHISTLTPSEYEKLLAVIGTKLNIINSIYVITNINQADLTNEGQVYYLKTTKELYQVVSGVLIKFLLPDYVAKSSSSNIVYGRDDTQEVVYPIDDFVDGNVVRRNTNGNIYTPLPQAASDATPKQYVDSALALKADKVGALPEFTGLTFSTNILTFIATNNLSGKPFIFTASGFKFRALITIAGSTGTFYLDQINGNTRYSTDSYIDLTNKTIGDLFAVQYEHSFELKENKVTSINSSSTDTEYPSAKAVYTSEQNLRSILQTAINQSGHSIDLSIDSNYDMVLKLIDANGNIISQDDIDLPLESIVVSATYYDTYTYDGTIYSKVIVIVLATTSVPTIVPVGDLVSGLVNESTFNSAMALKADKSDTYTKPETNTLLAGKVTYTGEVGSLTLGEFVSQYGGIGKHVCVIQITGSQYLLTMYIATIGDTTLIGFLYAISLEGEYVIRKSPYYHTFSKDIVMANLFSTPDVMSYEYPLSAREYNDNWPVGQFLHKDRPSFFILNNKLYIGAYQVGEISAQGNRYWWKVEIESLSDNQRWYRYSSGTGDTPPGTFADVMVDANLHQYEDTRNKVTSLSSSSTDTQYPSAKCVWNECQNIRAVAEGKTNTYVLSYEDTIASIKQEATLSQDVKFLVWNSTTNEFEDKTSDLLNGDYDSVTLMNSQFNSQNSLVVLSGSPIAFRTIDGNVISPTISGHDYFYIDNFATYSVNDKLKIGDIFYVLEQDVPDRWVSSKTPSQWGGAPIALSALESKSNLSNYYTKTEIDSWFTDVSIDED